MSRISKKIIYSVLDVDKNSGKHKGGLCGAHVHVYAMCIHVYAMCMHVCAWKCVQVQACLHVCTCGCDVMHVSACTCKHMCACMYLQVHVCVHTCVECMQVLIGTHSHGMEPLPSQLTKPKTWVSSWTSFLSSPLHPTLQQALSLQPPNQISNPATCFHAHCYTAS